MKTGAASIMVELKDSYFPNVESVLKHDDVYIRVILIETDKRYAFLEADMPSMFPSEVKYCKDLLKKLAGVEHCNSWIAVSHSFSAPHTWFLEAEQKDTYRPKELDSNPRFMEIAQLINEAYRDAYETAVNAALADMRESVCGFEKGVCGINVNRNMETADGWWEGVNYEGYADHTLSVLRFNDLSGQNIAVIYNYSMQVGVMAGEFPDLGGRVTSADVVGVSSLYVEKELGGTAMFLCGATGDQAPMFKCNYMENDKDGHHRMVNIGYASAGILKSMGYALGNSILQTAQKITCDQSPSDIISIRRGYVCKCKKREINMHKMKPTRSYDFIADGTRDMTVDALIIGDIALVGLQPELDGITVAQIRDRSPYDNTMVACFINGNGKSMPQRESYHLIQRAAINSPFAEGSAEQTRDVAVGLLHDIKTNQT